MQVGIRLLLFTTSLPDCPCGQKQVAGNFLYPYGLLGYLMKCRKHTPNYYLYNCCPIQVDNAVDNDREENNGGSRR